MTLREDIALLARVALLRELTDEQIRLIAFGAERRAVSAGEALFFEGEEAPGGFVVAYGQIDLVAFRGRREIVIDECHQYALIGETALVAAGKRPTAAVARVNSQVLFISRVLFHRMLNGYPEAADMLRQRIARTVSIMLARMEAIEARLAANPGLMALRRPAGDGSERDGNGED